MVLKDNISKEKKYYKTGSGKLVNYSFVPAICNKLYIDWVKSVQSVVAGQEEMATSKDMKELEVLGEKVALEASELTDTRDKIITYILENNTQKFEITEDTMYEIMSVENMNSFVQTACGVNQEEDEIKKK